MCISIGVDGYAAYGDHIHEIREPLHLAGSHIHPSGNLYRLLEMSPTGRTMCENRRFDNSWLVWDYLVLIQFSYQLTLERRSIQLLNKDNFFCAAG